MDGRVGAFEPVIELHELVLAEPAGALDLGIGGNFGGRIAYASQAFED